MMASTTAPDIHVYQVHVGDISDQFEALSIEASCQTTADEITNVIARKLNLKQPEDYELAEVSNNNQLDTTNGRAGGILSSGSSSDNNAVSSSSSCKQKMKYNFFLRKKIIHSMNFSWTSNSTNAETEKLRSSVHNFLFQPDDREYPDLCQLPDLTEQTLFENLKARFAKDFIYTYVGSILIAVNPFKIIPIYQPHMNSLYQSPFDRLSDLPPHIFAIAAASYHAMLQKKENQTIVISGESGSGKTTTTTLILQHLSSLSQNVVTNGVESILLSAGPVLEAFGNAKTKHNDNSSRFGKFIQIYYRENGMVNGAIVQKYLLEKSRIVSQSDDERNYHAFYRLTAGASAEERKEFHLANASDYFYLNQTRSYKTQQQQATGSNNVVIDPREADGFNHLKKSMEICGFSQEKQQKVFSVLAVVLHLGNVQFMTKSKYNDEILQVRDPSIVKLISDMLGLKCETLLTSLTSKKTRAAKGETLMFSYKLHEAIATRDAMAKCLYAALFDWIVMRINQALLSKRENRDFKRNYIGILDIFGFEDFGDQNYFEQFCINFANEHLHHYFNQHVFKYEQEEYKSEGIAWEDIHFVDNIECLKLIEERPNGLLCILDDQCNLKGANNQSMLTSFANQHKNNSLFEVPQRFKDAFIIKHYTGKVKYQITDFREKNSDLMRPDIACVLKSSKSTFVRELVGTDPLAMFRWQILRAFLRAYFIFSKIRQASSMKLARLNPIPPIRFHQQLQQQPQHHPHHHSSQLANAQHHHHTYHHHHHSNHHNCSSQSNHHHNSLQQLSSSYSSSNSILVSHTNNNSNNGNASASITAAGSPRHSSNNNSCSKHGEDKQPCANVLKEMILQKADKVIQKRSNQRQLNKIPSFRGRPEKSINLLLTLKALTSNRTTNNYHSQLLRSNSAKRSPTVTAQFQMSLHQLLETLNRANPYFVRCIKPNKDKRAEHFDDVCVLLQLRYTGMLETVRIRQSGYPVRLPYTQFAKVYRVLLKNERYSSREDIQMFLEKLKLNPAHYQMGETKVFMRETVKFDLDTVLHKKILRLVVFVQRRVRQRLAERKQELMMAAAAAAVASASSSVIISPVVPPRKTLVAIGGNQITSTSAAAAAVAAASAVSQQHQMHQQMQQMLPPTPPISSNWNVTRTSEFTDPKDILITDVRELQSMYMFVFKKICRMEEQKKCAKESTVDFVFKQALKEFRLNLLSTYSVASFDGRLKISYKDLIDHFEHVIKNICEQRRTWNSFPVIMGLNAFRGYLDEFRALPAKKVGLDKLVANTHRRRENPFMRRANKRRMKEVVERKGHKMFMTIANIPTVCEICTSLVKLGSRILVCNDCKLTCHKKCISNVVVSCRDNSLIQQGKKVFGAPLNRLVSEEERIPVILEQLMTAIEIRGLYVEGLYRKSAAQSKINELKQRLEEDRQNVDIHQYSVHVWTGVFKSFFREMPEPLMTFQLYDEFLWATAIVDLQERSQVIFSHINKLNKANYDLLERLTFHLSRVAMLEHANKMNASSLAIVFAPCILRTDKVMRAQDSFTDIKKQTICLECIITERMKHVKETLTDIDILDRATHTAEAQLSSIRKSAVNIRHSIRADSLQSSNAREEEARLTQKIENLQSEKSHLTDMLPSFRILQDDDDDDVRLN